MTIDRVKTGVVSARAKLQETKEQSMRNLQSKNRHQSCWEKVTSIYVGEIREHSFVYEVVFEEENSAKNMSASETQASVNNDAAEVSESPEEAGKITLSSYWKPCIVVGASRRAVIPSKRHLVANFLTNWLLSCCPGRGHGFIEPP